MQERTITKIDALPQLEKKTKIFLARCAFNITNY